MVKPKIGSKQLLLESFLATFVVYSLLIVFGLILKISFKPFDFVSQLFEDVKISDLYFSGLSNDSANPEITLVNIEDVDREGIAALLLRVNEFDPKVIGLDVFFSDRVDEVGDPLLFQAIENIGDKLVLTVLYDDEKNKPAEGFKYFDGVNYGHASLISNTDRTKVVREFNPYFVSSGDSIWSFSSLIAKKYNPESFLRFMHRNNMTEDINYVGDANSFVRLNYNNLFAMQNSELEQMLKGKIVMLGFMGGVGKDASDFNDIFFTPLNPRFAGRSYPDMYGLAIHANITTMILRGNYINHLPYWLVILSSFIFTFLVNVALMNFYIRNQMWYDISAKFTQFISSVMLVFIVFIIFRYTNLLIPSTYLILGVVFAVDMLYVYESIAIMAFKYFGWKSMFLKKDQQ